MQNGHKILELCELDAYFSFFPSFFGKKLDIPLRFSTLLMAFFNKITMYEENVFQVHF